MVLCAGKEVPARSCIGTLDIAGTNAEGGGLRDVILSAKPTKISSM